MSKKILITGSSGFVGSHLVQRLREKYDLLLPSRKELDLTDYSNIYDYLSDNKDVNRIIHLAAVCGGIGINQKAPAEFFMQNSLMGLNILKASHEFKIDKLVTLGSVCSYPKFTPIPFKEEDIWDGYPEETNAPYGMSKKNLLMGCKVFNEQYGSNFIHLLPVNMYGEYDDFDLDKCHVIPALLRKFVDAKEKKLESVTVWGDGSASREFLYAGDCAKAIHMALSDYNDPAPVNIGTGVEITIKDLATKIAKIVGFEGAICYDTSKPNGQPRRCLDTTRAQEGFGFKAQTSLDEGLKKTYNWYLKNVVQ